MRRVDGDGLTVQTTPGEGGRRGTTLTGLDVPSPQAKIVAMRNIGRFGDTNEKNR